MTYKKSLASLICVLFLAGCEGSGNSGDDNGGNKNGGNTGTGGGTTPGNNTGGDTGLNNPTTGTANLAGTWKSNCQRSANGGSSSEEISFNGEKYNWTILNYNSDDCSGEVSSFLKPAGGFKTGAQAFTGTTPAGDVKPIALDYTIDSLQIAPVSEQTVNNFNQQSLCGVTTWVSKQAQEVINAGCFNIQAGQEVKVWIKVTANSLKISEQQNGQRSPEFGPDITEFTR